MNKDYTSLRNKSTQKEQWNRAHSTEGIIDFEQAKKTKNQREFAEQSGILRSTLQHWIKCKGLLDASPVAI